MANIVYGRGDPCGRPVVGTSQPVVGTSQTVDECVSLVYITASQECSLGLLRAARRIRRNIRCADAVVLLERVCAIALPATPLQGAQAVAGRVSTLLVDIDCTFQVFSGRSALALWQRLQSQHARVIDTEETEVEHLYAHPGAERENVPAQSMPYLAFLANYPPYRLLHLFSYELACRYQCVPVGAERDMLTIGTSRRLDESVIAHMQEVTQRRIFQVRCDVSMIDDVLRYWQSVQTSTTLAAAPLSANFRGDEAIVREPVGTPPVGVRSRASREMMEDV